MTEKQPKKALSKQDLALWKKVTKTIEQSEASNNQKAIKPKAKPQQTSQSKNQPLPNRDDFAALLNETTTKAAQPDQARQQPIKQPAQPNSKPKTPTLETFTDREARNISSGKQHIEGAIDLHGLTQRQAETALTTFLKRAQTDGKRWVLVITGKGQSQDYKDQPFELGGPEPGVLRRSVPNWLENIPNIVLSYTTSHKKHGGEGALYVRLRKFK